MKPAGATSNALLGVATAWCRVEALVCRRVGPHALIESMQRLSGAAWAAALSRDEKSRLTLGIYDASPVYRSLPAALFPIEETLFGRELPAAPARVLVGACGAGREAIVLARRGYHVHALEPAAAFAAESRRRLGGGVPIAQLSYEALNAIVLDGAQDAETLAGARVDAVVLGCGSLSHVLDGREQRRLFQSLNTLCPTGPWLASFLWAHDDEAAAAPAPGRAARWGGRIGRLLAWARGLPLDRSPRLSYQAARGFAYTFTRREIEHLACDVGRRVVWERDGARSTNYASFLRGH